MNNKRVRLYTRKRNGNMIVLIVAAVALLYFVIQAAHAITGTVETVAATRVTVEDVMTIEGCFLRDEVIVEAVTSPMVKHTAATGERVKSGASLAVVYRGENALSASKELESLQEERSLLQTAIQSAGDYSDTSRLDKQLTSGMRSLNDQIKQGITVNARHTAENLRELSLRRAAGSLETAGLRTQLNALDARISALKKQVSGRTQQIVSPGTGYFSETVDGYETILRTELLEQMDYERFIKLHDQEPTAEKALGKIIQGFTWYFVAPITTEEAARLRVGRNVSLRLSQTGETVLAHIYSVRRSDDHEHALAIFSGTRFNSSVVSLRDQEVDVIIGTYTGLKVPKEAVRVFTNTTKDDEGAVSESRYDGVYIISGSVTRKKKIIPLYEADTYYVVRQENNAHDANDVLVMQDRIIVKGKDIEDKKVIQT